ncbi:MAG: CRTAC1 family protein [Vicinamibacterales bacterium]
MGFQSSCLTVAALLAIATALTIPGTGSAAADQRSPSVPVTSATFKDVAAAAGLNFTHISGASERKHLPEILGSGGLFFDFDDDGWVDVFLVDGGSIADPAVGRRARHRLFRNRRNGTFEDATPGSGIQHRDYGMGACAGDYDNDGLIDLYVTNVGPNVLYRNAGQGRFTQVPNAGGADTAMWSTSCAFLDVDRDGDLDLFVTNYVDIRLPPSRDALRRTGKPDSTSSDPFCGNAGPPPIRDYCHPLIYSPLTSVLYRNAGNRFEDISKQSGVGAFRGNGLGVAVADVDDDGWPDVFVANDAMPNFLFHNNGNGTFAEIASLAGVAVTAGGNAKAGMGTAFADFSGNGRPGLIVTNHETEMHSLFVNVDGRLFSDVTVRSGVGAATRPYVGFGVVFFDYDNDMRLDIAIANGHVLANVARLRAGGSYAQRRLLLRNNGDRFQDMKDQAGSGFAPEMVGRGLAAADIDNDGDVDLLVTNNNAPPNLLLNDGGSGNAVIVRALGTTGNRSAIGTRLVLTTGQRRQIRDVQSGSSYLAQNDLRAHFGLGQAKQSERLEIRWPAGMTEVVENLPANHVITVREGKGIVGRVPFTR